MCGARANPCDVLSGRERDTIMTEIVSGLRSRLRYGEFTHCTFSIITSPTVVDVIGVAGFDAVILDMEHGPHTRTTVLNALFAASARALYSIVRVPDTTESTIQAVLDMGADAVLVPQVSSAEDARRVVAAARFAPSGARGVNPWVRAGDYDAQSGRLFSEANARIAVLVMIESRSALDELGAILETDGLDGVFVGPVDLASSLGFAGEPEHPQVLAALDHVITKAGAAGVATAAFAPTLAMAATLKAQGVTLIACGQDTQILHVAMREIVERL